VHGILLCQAETAGAVRAFVESCRYPNQLAGVDPDLPTPRQRLEGTAVPAGARAGPDGRTLLGVGTRGRGSEATSAPIWGLSEADYFRCCDPWPLNSEGDLILGVKLESPEGIARCEEVLSVPGIGFAELGPGDLGLSLGYVEVPRPPYPPEMADARARVFAACRAQGVAFMEAATPETVAERIDEGVRLIGGRSEATARVGRAHTKRTLPV
jgi:4-hydroxy-2-oxoheptanedioate aldolase